jgi:hypothetical protein
LHKKICHELPELHEIRKSKRAIEEIPGFVRNPLSKPGRSNAEQRSIILSQEIFRAICVIRGRFKFVQFVA